MKGSQAPPNLQVKTEGKGGAPRPGERLQVACPQLLPTVWVALCLFYRPRRCWVACPGVPQLEGTEVEAGPDFPVLRPMAFPTVWAPRDIRN